MLHIRTTKLQKGVSAFLTVPTKLFLVQDVVLSYPDVCAFQETVMLH